MCFRRGTVCINQGHISKNVRKVWQRVIIHVKAGILMPAFLSEIHLAVYDVQLGSVSRWIGELPMKLKALGFQ